MSIDTVGDNSFFCTFFMALGQSRFKFYEVRSVVVVDETHLKGRYTGILYVASYFDGNE